MIELVPSFKYTGPFEYNSAPFECVFINKRPYSN